MGCVCSEHSIHGSIPVQAERLSGFPLTNAGQNLGTPGAGALRTDAPVLRLISGPPQSHAGRMSAVGSRRPRGAEEPLLLLVAEALRHEKARATSSAGYRVFTDTLPRGCACATLRFWTSS